MLMEKWAVSYLRRSFRGFTLVELLVVISIIAMLMSIMMPVLGRARGAGKGIHCLSNLHQLTLAWNLYAMENKDKLCSSNTYWNDGVSSGNWVADGYNLPTNHIGGTEDAITNGVLWPFTGIVEVYKCKSDPDELLRSYSISRNMGSGLPGVGYRNLADISRVSEKMVFIDAKCYTFFSSPHRWIELYYEPITFSISSNQSRWTTAGGTTARHYGGCNMSFADLHCEYWRYKSPQTIKLASEEITDIFESDNNRDMKRMIELLRGKGKK